MTNEKAQAGTYLLYRAFRSQHLGEKTGIPEGPWMIFDEVGIPKDYWVSRVGKVGALAGDAIKDATQAFIKASPDPLQGLIAHQYAPVPSGLGLGGVRSLAVELFGKHEAPSSNEDRTIAVCDNHLHGGLAYDRRSLLTALVKRRAKIVWPPTKKKSAGDDAEPAADNPVGDLRFPRRDVMLMSAIRWSIWLLECMVEQGSWNLPEFASSRVGAWDLVTKEQFWPTVRAVLDGEPLSGANEDILRVQVWEANADQINDATLEKVLQKWDWSITRANDLVRELIEMGILKCRPAPHGEGRSVIGTKTRLWPYPFVVTGQAEVGAKTPSWPYGFVVNTIRAVVALFGEVPAWPGEGFTRFQCHCGQASELRKAIFSADRPDKPQKPPRPEDPAIAAQRASILNAMRRYPAPYFLDGFELRREIDPGKQKEAMTTDIVDGVSKLWMTYEAVVKSPSPYVGGKLPQRFCAPVSFQRPRLDWKVGKEPAYATDNLPVAARGSRRYAAPWEQVHYVASMVAALRSARTCWGGDVFDRAVGSVDVSGIEIAHATWPYVAAINLLHEDGCNLKFTAHAGESFERSSTGIRTIGQLFLGDRAPDRIGHASALDARMRRMITKQQRHTEKSHEPYRFDDFLQDLCFTSIVLSELGRDDTCEKDFITELTASDMDAWPIEPEVWIDAFRWLHTTGPVVFAIEEIERGRDGFDVSTREEAEAKWRTLEPGLGRDESFKHAVQQFVFGEVIDRGMAGRTPICARDGIPGNLQRRLIEHLESRTTKLEKWVSRKIVDSNTLIECCPTSNLALAGVREYEDHPVWGFLQKQGVRFSINSDDPLVFGGFGGEELAALHAGYGSNLSELQRRLSELSSSDAHAVVPPVDKDFLTLVLSKKEPESRT